MKSLLQRLIGASFSISIFFIVVFIYISFNLFQFHELVTSLWVWAIFFGYGIISSILIDCIGKLIPRFTIDKQILLYILFGCLILLYTLPAALIFFLIAGTIGAFFSLLFLLGKEKLKVSKWYSWLAFIVPLICIGLMPFDHTSKQGWEEVREDQSVEISYESFNGEHLIPLHGEEGDRVYFEVDHRFRRGSHHGVGSYDKESNSAVMNPENNDFLFSVSFEEETTTYIVVRAINGQEGQITVEWWEEDDV